jgi:Cytochrome c554 and c-prime
VSAVRAPTHSRLLLLLALGACVRPEPLAGAGGGGPSVPAAAPVVERLSPEALKGRAVLYLSADVRGALAPCGCSDNMRGGIARAGWLLAETRERGLPVLYVDGGNTLFGAPVVSPSQVVQEEARARTLAQALQRMGLAVRATGPLDDARGRPFREQLGLPTLVPGRGRALDVGGHRVGVVSARTAAELTAGAAEARRAGARFVVGLLQLTLEEAQPLAARPDTGADLLLAAVTPSELAGEENRLVRAAVPLVGLQSKGRSLLRVDLAFGEPPGPFQLQRGQGDLERELAAVDARLTLLDREVNHPAIPPALKQLKQAKREELAKRRQVLSTSEVAGLTGYAFTLRFVALEAGRPSLPEVAEVVAAYDAQVGQLNLAWARTHGQDCPAPAEGQAAFVGSATCRTCHPAAFAVFDASKHAHAWETLVTLGKQHHLNCAGCHVTGWEQPGGVCRIDRTAGREGVGCESCHGPGSRHVAAPSPGNIQGRPDEQACTGCHNRENSPHFDFATYVPRIVGPGHGAPPVRPDAG